MDTRKQAGGIALDRGLVDIKKHVPVTILKNSGIAGDEYTNVLVQALTERICNGQ